MYPDPEPPEGPAVSVNAPGMSPVQTISVAEVIVPATNATTVTDSDAEF